MSSISEGMHFPRHQSRNNLKFFGKMSLVYLASIMAWLLQAAYLMFIWFVVTYIILFVYTIWLANLTDSYWRADFAFTVVAYGAGWTAGVFTFVIIVFMLLRSSNREGGITTFPWHIELKRWAYKGRDKKPKYLEKIEELEPYSPQASE